MPNNTENTAAMKPETNQNTKMIRENENEKMILTVNADGYVNVRPSVVKEAKKMNMDQANHLKIFGGHESYRAELAPMTEAAYQAYISKHAEAITSWKSPKSLKDQSPVDGR